MILKYIGILLMIFMLICPASYARDFEYGDSATIGNLDWFVDSDGDIEPAVDSSQDLGADGNELQAIYVDSVNSLDGLAVLNQINVGVDGGAADAYYVSMTPSIASYRTGTMIMFRAKNANTGACTLDVNGLGVKSIKSLNDATPASGYIEAGSMVIAVFDYTSNVWELIQPDANP